jgi:hypothetical protein
VRRSRDNEAGRAAEVTGRHWVGATLSLTPTSESTGTRLEHLPIDDADASAMMKACDVNLRKLTDNLANYIDKQLKGLVIGDGRGTRPTAGFQRVMQRAVIQTHGLGRC